MQMHSLLPRRKLLLILLAVIVTLGIGFGVTYNQSVLFRFTLQDKANRDLTTTAYAANTFETERTILNDVWDSDNHMLRISGSGIGLTLPISLTGSVGTGTVVPDLALVPGSNTGLTASTERNSVFIDTSTQEWATGALAIQNKIKILGNTLSAVGASTFTESATLSISGPIKGPNVAATQLEALVVPTWNCSTATTCIGAVFNAPSGATNNYAAQFSGGFVQIGSVLATQALTISAANNSPIVRITGTSSPELNLDRGTEYTGFQLRRSSEYGIAAWENKSIENVALLFATNNLLRGGFVAGGDFFVGAGEAGTPTAGKIRGANATGTNIAGVTTTLQASLGTGTGALGTLVFSAAATAQASGTTAHTAAAHLTLGSNNATVNAHYVSTGTAPAVSSCGTSPSIVGTDTAGKVTIGSAPGTSCLLTFATAYTNAPACSTSDETTAILTRGTSTTTTLTISGVFVGGDVVAYNCFGRA